MNATAHATTHAAVDARSPVAAPPSVPELIGTLYETAPAVERSRLLEQLLGPLGLLSMVAVADGVFARLRFRAGWPGLHVRPEDTHLVGAREVAALAEHALQVSVDVMGQLVQTIAASPTLAGSAAAGLLIALLAQGARRGAVGSARAAAPARAAG
ncbi:MAG: hypothetical protein KGI90_13260 [Burkholderiales bacterium]|nr:hypothetical protein [Burkholderiales bacterium]